MKLKDVSRRLRLDFAAFSFSCTAEAIAAVESRLVKHPVIFGRDTSKRADSDTDLLVLLHPEIDEPTCIKIAADVRAAHAARRRAQALQERAKRAVEVAIEKSEAAALRFLAEPLGGTA